MGFLLIRALLFQVSIRALIFGNSQIPCIIYHILCIICDIPHTVYHLLCLETPILVWRKKTSEVGASFSSVSQGVD